MDLDGYVTMNYQGDLIAVNPSKKPLMFNKDENCWQELKDCYAIRDFGE